MKRETKSRTEEGDPLEDATRLLEQGRTTAALQMLVPLHETYADDPEIAIALGLASLKTHRIARACQVFARFVTRWPRHRKTEQIQQAYDDLAEARGQRLAFLGLTDDEIDFAVAFEESNAFLGAGQFAQAREVTEVLLASRPHCAPARNNLSYLMWLDGDAAGARLEAERVCQDDPENLQALCHLVRYHVLDGDVEGATKYAARLRSLPNATSDACAAKMEALSFLPDDRGVVAIYEQAVAPDSSQDGTNPMLHHLGAVAHARLGNEAAARSLWHQALRVNSEFELARTNLDDAKARAADRHGAWPFSLSNWIAARDLSDLQQRLQSLGEHGIEAAMSGWLSPRPGSTELVKRLLSRGDPVGREFGIMLATHGRTVDMDAALRSFALGPDGPDAQRLAAFRRVVDRELLPRGPIRMWLRGEHRFTLPQAHDLLDEPRADPRTRKLQEQLDSGQVDAAEATANDLTADVPLGRIGLARVALARGHHGEAAQLLDAVLDRARLTRSELAALCEAQVMTCESGGHRDVACGWLDVWAQVRSDAPALSGWRKKLEA